MPSKRSPYGRGSRAARCRLCDAQGSPELPISARALCVDCANEQMRLSAVQQSAGAGRYYETWVASMIDHAHRLASR